MGKLGNVGVLARETGPHSARSFRDLDGRLGIVEGIFSRVVQNGEIVASHANLQDLDYASSGHTGFASSVSLAAHIADTANPHATTLQQAIASNATASSEPTFNGGLDIGTSGRFDSNVADGANVKQFYFKPTVALTTATARRFQVDDDSGNVQVALWKNGVWEFAGATLGGTGDAVISISNSITFSGGIQFAPTFTTSGGITMVDQANTIVGGTFRIGPSATVGSSLANVVGGIFQTAQVASQSANVSDWWGGWFRPTGDVLANNSARTFTNVGGWKVWGAKTGKNFGAITNLYGGYIADMSTNATAAGFTLANQYALWIDEQTRATTTKVGIWLANATAAYKAIVIRDANAWIGSSAAARIDIGATEFLMQSTKIGAFNVAPIVQPTTAVAAATFVANTSLIFDDSATWDGYTIGQVVKALRNLGWLA